MLLFFLARLLLGLPQTGSIAFGNTNVYLPIASLLAQQPPFTTTFNVTANPAKPLTLANGFSSAAATGTFNTFAADPHLRVATAHNWQVSVQRDSPDACLVFGYPNLGRTDVYMPSHFGLVRRRSN